MDEEYGKPTAIKQRGTEWYWPAVTTATGPKRLPHGERQESRYLAKKEAAKALREVDRGGPERIARAH